MASTSTVGVSRYQVRGQIPTFQLHLQISSTTSLINSMQQTRIYLLLRIIIILSGHVQATKTVKSLNCISIFSRPCSAFPASHMVAWIIIEIVIVCDDFLWRTVSLKLGLNENRGYRTPVNVNRLGENFLYFGFIPASMATNRKQQGLRVCMLRCCRWIWYRWILYRGRAKIK